MNRHLKLKILFVTAVVAGFAWAGLQPPARCQEPAAKRAIVPQREIGENGCEPCALYNCLVFGDSKLGKVAKALPGTTAIEKVRHVISKYGVKPSEAYGDKQPRYDDKDGITWVDLRHLVNDLLRDHKLNPAEGRYLDRQKEEKPVEHLRRVYRLLRGSLDAGFPPVLSIRSF